jgi:hypothetical protein
VSRIGEIQALVRNGLYYITEHADDEALEMALMFTLLRMVF